jgi:hypothetical protein
MAAGYRQIHLSLSFQKHLEQGSALRSSSPKDYELQSTNHVNQTMMFFTLSKSTKEEEGRKAGEDWGAKSA